MLSLTFQRRMSYTRCHEHNRHEKNTMKTLSDPRVFFFDP